MPARCIMSTMRPPNTPLTPTMASSPVSSRLVTTHSIPAIPVAETGKVMAFLVWKTSRSRAQVSSMISM